MSQNLAIRMRLASHRIVSVSHQSTIALFLMHLRLSQSVISPLIDLSQTDTRTLKRIKQSQVMRRIDQAHVSS